jgi:hypothetical protein
MMVRRGNSLERHGHRGRVRGPSTRPALPAERAGLAQDDKEVECFERATARSLRQALRPPRRTQPEYSSQVSAKGRRGTLRLCSGRALGHPQSLDTQRDPHLPTAADVGHRASFLVILRRTHLRNIWMRQRSRSFVRRSGLRMTRGWGVSETRETASLHWTCGADNRKTKIPRLPLRLRSGLGCCTASTISNFRMTT